MRRMVLAWLLSCILPSADASMVIDGTRIIFPGDKKEIAVRATNMGRPLSDAGLGRRWPRAKSTGKRFGAVYCAAADCAYRAGKGPELAPDVQWQPSAAGSGVAVLVQSAGHPA